MKNLIYQFYNEGFASLFCKKPINYLKKHIKNKTIINILSFIIRFIYTILIIILAIIIFKRKYPF